MTVEKKALEALRELYEKVLEQSDKEEIWKPYNKKLRHPAQGALLELHDIIERYGITLFEKIHPV